MFSSRDCLGLLLAIALPAARADRIGDIEFFGYAGLDVEAVRKALPVREGDAYTDEVPDRIRQAVNQLLRRAPTDIAAPCCDENGKRFLYIGLPGGSYKSFVYLPPPTGDERLPANLMSIYDRLGDAMYSAVRKGGDAAREDDSRGFALNQDPPLRHLQLELRQWAVLHESVLLPVLERSSHAGHRAVAAHVLGYANRSRHQVLGLAQAGSDPNESVRNNATRALGVLARADVELPCEIPPETFIKVLSSGSWTDRNKAALLLSELTTKRDTKLLAAIRDNALEALIEMALWRPSGHAAPSRLILGRVAGIPEDRLQELTWKAPTEEIIRAARAR
jgi:hypothetical protein